MSILVNFKICDNTKECSGVAVCRSGALSWNNEKKSIEIDNNKCISCGLCEIECSIGAIMVAKNEEEYKKIKNDIDNDVRIKKDLFVDRYGASAISEYFKIQLSDINGRINNDNLTLIEIYNPDIAECLLKSIPIKELTKDLPEDTVFYKAESDKIIEEYQITKLPALLIFKKGKLIGNINGYYCTDEKKEMLSKINKILNN